MNVHSESQPLKQSASIDDGNNRAFITRRERYIFETLKFNHDPFINPSAEKELQIKPEDPPFFSYFVDIPYQKEDGLLLDRLKEPGTAIIYGKPGSGKSTLRYMLEWMCRTMPERTLVISYNLGKGEPIDLDAGVLWGNLAESFAKDLFIQVLEQFDFVSTRIDRDMVRDFSLFWQQYIPNFRRIIERSIVQYQLEAKEVEKSLKIAQKRKDEQEDIPFTQASEPGIFAGVAADISKWWIVWDRPMVRYTSLTPEMKLFLENILSYKKSEVVEESDGRGVLWGVNLAKQLRYEQLFLLVDVVGVTRQDQFNIDTFLTFLEELNLLQLPVDYKLFLPDEFETAVTQYFSAKELTPPKFSAIIKWDNPEAFNKLISNRLQQASQRTRKMSTIMSPEVAAQFKKMINEENGRTPRYILQTISHLIEAHARHAPDHYQIGLDDWEWMEKEWAVWE